MNTAPVEMRVFLAKTTIKLNDLLGLQPGDIITTEKPSGADVFVQVEGKNKFLCASRPVPREPGGARDALASEVAEVTAPDKVSSNGERQ